MKKIINSIAKFFVKVGQFIYKIVDKVIITPVSKFVYFIIDKISSKPGKFERFLNKPNTLIFVSLLCAFVTFIFVDQKIISLVETEAKVLTNQSIEVEYNEEAYVIDGVPDTADIILMGRKADLYLAGQLMDHKLTLDLANLSAGTHKVYLKYNNPINTLDYKLDPSYVTVVIYPKVSEVRSLTIDVLNKDKLNEILIVSSVKLNRDEVIIKSNKEKLGKVALVKAIVDVNALNATSAGTYTLDNVKLIAYDEKGTEIKDIEIVPDSVTATVVITSPSKTVPIKIVPVGEVSSGSAISTITSNINKVTIYGEEAALADIENIEVEIDVNGLNADKTYQEDITKPQGVRSMSVNSITIKVEMEKETSKEFDNISLEIENLADGLQASGATENDTKVSVVVKGVSKLLESLDSKSIRAYVDLSDLGVGTYQVPVVVSGSDLKLSYTPKTQKVTVIITKK